MPGILMTWARRTIEGLVMKKPITHTKNADGTETVDAFVRVLLYRDGRHFIAQSLEIDYCAAGLTLEQAKSNFSCGFIETINMHLQVFGSVDRLHKQAPSVFFKEFYDALSSQMSDDYELPAMAAVGVPRRLRFFGEALSPA